MIEHLQRRQTGFTVPNSPARTPDPPPHHSAPVPESGRRIFSKDKLVLQARLAINQALLNQNTGAPVEQNIVPGIRVKKEEEEEGDDQSGEENLNLPSRVNW